MAKKNHEFDRVAMAKYREQQAHEAVSPQTKSEQEPNIGTSIVQSTTAAPKFAKNEKPR